MPQVQLTLVIHNHQPVGNFDHVFAQACQRAYLPFLRMLLEFPAVRIGLHTSGCLWEWVEAHRPEYGRLVDELLARGQVELLGGGMYEPILPVLPARDALWQLRRMNRFLEERFGKEPAGAWIPERVWEPQLPELLAQAGLRYCLLDDYHFEGNAPAEQIGTEYFATDHAGCEVALLPISKQLRYTIPFKPPQDTLDYLRNLGGKAQRLPLAVFGDDGEKFGIWPDTHEWVYERGWLHEFFRSLTGAQDWLQILLPSEVLKQREPAGHVYLPSRSYYEMGEWTRVGAADGDGLPGHWRNFFHKYPESRQLFARVCAVSDSLHEHGAVVAEEAWDDLGRAQCNCCYWHGVFGGLYLNYLRAALTRHLLKAELAAGVVKPNCPEWLSNSELAVTIHPEHGLSVSRLDYYPTLFNWADVVARRSEHYHSKLLEAALQAQAGAAEADEQASIHDIVRVKEAGLERMLVVDAHPRHSFMTYCSTVQSAAQLMYADLEAPQREHEDWGVAASEVAAQGSSVAGRINHGMWSIRKQVTLSEQGLTSKIEFDGAPPCESGPFFIELNLTVLTDQADDRYLLVNGERKPLDEGLEFDDTARVMLVDEWQQRRCVIEASQPARLITYPVRTVSSSESGFERTYQGTCLMFGFDPAGLNSLELSLRIEGL